LSGLELNFGRFGGVLMKIEKLGMRVFERFMFEEEEGFEV
jgi:hypothetical protein